MRFADARRYALELPEAAAAPHHQYESFRVRGKIFATVPPDREHLHVFVGEEQRELALARYPDAAEKLWWGKKVLGLRIRLQPARAAFVKELLLEAWRLKAPKSLAVQYGRPDADDSGPRLK
jgi:hypothetical protein